MMRLIWRNKSGLVYIPVTTDSGASEAITVAVMRFRAFISSYLWAERDSYALVYWQRLKNGEKPMQEDHDQSQRLNVLSKARGWTAPLIEYVALLARVKNLGLLIPYPLILNNQANKPFN
ncbi:jg18470 [Pararge aegeria aegeria]|uniref:Jg18470 protein n=1 Tax=Pararge aegeria aegeria TaxID=348720 RepID=A0A8S4RJL5_9NEOP|nr:jg18470 [Pararge aegeria aegeria]